MRCLPLPSPLQGFWPDSLRELNIFLMGQCLSLVLQVQSIHTTPAFQRAPPPPKHKRCFNCLASSQRCQLAVLYLFCLGCKTQQLGKFLLQINCSLLGWERGSVLCHRSFTAFEAGGAGALRETESQRKEGRCRRRHGGQSETGLEFRAQGLVPLAGWFLSSEPLCWAERELGREEHPWRPVSGQTPPPHPSWAAWPVGSDV